MIPFEKHLAESVAIHGHLCPGQIVGVRMALLGMRLIDFQVPCTHDQLKRLIVFVEMDRCAADAIASVTGVKLGRRSLKFVDYGIMAATFADIDSERAVRVVSTEESRDLAAAYAPFEQQTRDRQLKAYRIMPDNVLFRVQRVKVHLDPCDLPGPTRFKATCERCGQVVRDRREVVRNGRVLCRPCADGAYFYQSEELPISGDGRVPDPGGAQAALRLVSGRDRVS